MWPLLLLGCLPRLAAPPVAEVPAPAAPPAEAPTTTALELRPTLLPSRTGPAPYPDEPTWLADELTWIEARIRRLALADRLHRQPESAAALAPTLRRRQETEEALRARIDARLTASAPRALDRLCQRLRLDDFERLVLLLAAAPCFSRSFESAFALLDRDGVPGNLTVEVIFSFARLPFDERLRRRAAFSPEQGLLRHDLITVDLGSRQVSPQDLLGAGIELTSRAFAWMIGEEGALGELTAFSSVEEPRADLSAVVLPAASRDAIEAAISSHDALLRRRADWGIDEVVRYGRGLMLLFYGPPGTGKTLTAHAVASHMGRRLLNVDVPTFLAHEEAGRFLPGLFREARLQDAVLFFDECETLMRSRLDGNALMSVLLTELERFEGVAVLATNQPWALDAALTRRILVRARFDPPDAEARAAIWRLHLPDTIPQADDIDLPALAARFPLTGGLIKNAVLSAVARTLLEDSPVLHGPHLVAAAAAQLHRPTDAPAAHPTAGLDALVLPGGLLARLRGIVSAARPGVIALEGTSGSGRSAVTAALAAELGWPLLSAGPAELSERLEQAGQQRAVLSVEGLEQVALEPSVLRRLESPDALVVIATADAAQLSEPLRARLTLRLALSRPDRRLRQRLWARLVPDGVDVAALSVHPLTGGQVLQVIASLQATDTPLTTASLSEAISALAGRVGF